MIHDDPTDDAERLRQVVAGPMQHLLVRTADLGGVLPQDEHSFEMILKKLVAYAPRSVVVGGPAQAILTLGGMYREDVRGWETNDKAFVRLRERARHARASQILFLPESVEKSVEDYDESDHAPTQFTRNEFDFHASYKGTYGTEVSFRDPTISSHMLGASQRTDVLQVWLPELKNVPLELLAKLRHDESDAFERFHFAVKKLIKATPRELSSTDRIKEVFEEVHHGVKSYQERMRTLTERGVLRATEVALGSAAMGLCFIASSPVAKMALSIIGAYSAKDFVRELFKQREDRRALLQDPFYAPWLCTKISSTTSSG